MINVFIYDKKLRIRDSKDMAKIKVILGKTLYANLFLFSLITIIIYPTFTLGMRLVAIQLRRE